MSNAEFHWPKIQSLSNVTKAYVLTQLFLCYPKQSDHLGALSLTI